MPTMNVAKTNWWTKFLDRVQSRLIASAAKHERIFTLQCEPSWRCNLRCRHCYLGDGPPRAVEELGPEQWRSILLQFAELNTLLATRSHVALAGGEPLLLPWFEHFLNLAKELVPSCDLSVLTNGTLLDERRAKLLHHHRATVQLSLDGWDEPSHDQVRGAGSFHATCRGAILLRKHQVPFSLQCTLSHHNAEGIEAMFVLAKRLGARSMDFCRLIPSGRASGPASDPICTPLHGETLRQAFCDIFQASHGTGLTTNRGLPLMHLIEADAGGQFGQGFYGLTVQPDGGLRPTSRLGIVLGDLRRQDLRSLYFGAEFQALRTQCVEGCSACPTYERCGGGDRNAAYAEHGHFLSKDPGCWAGTDPQQSEGVGP
ncbi:MAG: hypothetical protein A2284_08835 [Deltaproteobacteria bacterium RIFOXYA12_FULL_61_11]|nr:MAG: hypothetical protein A2284_08835 [Deltaproteobacteria bacterium RIFOXYA12_FULL_61_11]